MTVPKAVMKMAPAGFMLAPYLSNWTALALVTVTGIAAVVVPFSGGDPEAIDDFNRFALQLHQDVPVEDAQ